MENTNAQQIELCASVHLAFEELESVDLPLDLAAAPRRGECRANCRQIRFEARCESTQLGHDTTTGLGQPEIEATYVAPVDQAEEVSGQTASDGDRRFDPAQRLDKALLIDALLLSFLPLVPANQPCIGSSRRRAGDGASRKPSSLILGRRGVRPGHCAANRSETASEALRLQREWPKSGANIQSSAGKMTNQRTEERRSADSHRGCDRWPAWAAARGNGRADRGLKG